MKREPQPYVGCRVYVFDPIPSFGVPFPPLHERMRRGFVERERRTRWLRRLRYDVRLEDGDLVSVPRDRIVVVQ